MDLGNDDEIDDKMMIDSPDREQTFKVPVTC